MDFFPQDFLRRFFGHCLDFDPAFGARYHNGSGGRPIEQNGKIDFARDVYRLRDQHLVDDAAGRPCLVGDQSLPKHFRRNVAHLLGRLAQVDSAFESIRERPLPSPAGVNLRLDYEIVRPQFSRRLLRFLRRGGSLAPRRGDAEFLQQFFRLIFVDVHRALSLTTKPLNGAPGNRKERLQWQDGIAKFASHGRG